VNAIFKTKVSLGLLDIYMELIKSLGRKHVEKLNPHMIIGRDPAVWTSKFEIHFLP
jgi:hypothetical protein